MRLFKRCMELEQLLSTYEPEEVQRALFEEMEALSERPTAETVSCRLKEWEAAQVARGCGRLLPF